MASEQRVTVGIIGGGPAGLTLANILEQAGISYILFEARDDIAPAEGASLGLMPNGLRILDQIGLIDQVEEYAVAHDYWEYRDGDGTLYNTLHAMRSYPHILGYGGYFMERQRVLEILYEGVKDKTRIRTGKMVCSVENLSTHATISTVDGEQIDCDFVVGADGVRSLVRRQIEAALPHLQKTPDNFATRYGCVYGMSNPLPQINHGRAFTVHQAAASLLIFAGAGGTLYWFLFVDLRETFAFGHTRRYTADDLDAAFALVADSVVTAGVRFSDVFAARRVAVMTPLEEGVADAWCWERMMLLGDSAHKMTPHAAMGAMQAMESAACFSSLLLQLRAERGGTLDGPLPRADVQQLLAAYQQKRQARARSVVQGAHFHCATQLKVADGTPMADQWLRRLPQLTNERWLAMSLQSLAAADMIEGWPAERNGPRVRKYVESARRVLAEAEERQKQMAAAAVTVAPVPLQGGGAVVPETRSGMVPTAA